MKLISRCLMKYVGLLPLLFACTSDNVIDKQTNVAPTILITSHSDGVELQDSYSESFRAVVSDDDNEFDELSVAWYIGEEIICDWETASPAGDSFCDIVFQEDDINVIAEVRDSQGSGGRHEIEVVILPTEAPIVEMLSPIATENYYSDQLIQFSALVSDEEDDVEDLIITWTSSLEGELAPDTSVNSDGEISDYTYLAEGNHAIEVRVEDTTGKVDTAEVVIQVGGENNIPTCSITEPLDGTSIVIGDTVTFRGTAEDPDIQSNLLQAEWSSDKDGVFGSSSPSSSGAITLAYDGLSSNSHTISLNVSDEVGALCTEQILIHISNPPLATIDQPLDGEVFSLGDTITFQGTVSDQEDLPNEINTIWTSSIDSELHNAVANSQGISQFALDNLAAGLHSITLSVTDSSGLISDDLISLRVNTPPVVDSISFSPDPVYSNDNLSITTNFSDEDGDNVTGSREWYEDGVLTAFTGTTINASELDVGETWTVKITPNDGYTDGNYLEQSITITNTEPTLSSVSISSNSGSFYNDSILSCSATASDIDETVTPTYSWSVNGNTYSGSSLDLSTTSAQPQGSIECLVSVSDSNGGSTTSSASITLDNRLPVLSSTSITPNTGVLTNTELTCSGTATDSDGETPTISYEWLLNGSSLGTSGILQLDNSLVSPNDTIECAITALDGFQGQTSQTVSITVDNSVPTITNISLLPTQVTPLTEVTCSASTSDLDGDTPNLSFSFQNVTTGVAYTPTSSTASDATLDLSTTSILPSEELSCTVLATDSDGGQSSASVNAIIISLAPTLQTSIQGSPYTNQAMTCLATATDYHGTDISSSAQFEWINISDNNATLSNQSAYTIDANETNVGDSILCTVTVVDSDGLSTTDSSSIIIDNTTPTISSILISSASGNHYNDEIVTCSATIEDIDETPSVSYTWSSGGINLGSTQTFDLSVTVLLPTDPLNCTIEVFDSNGGNTSDTSVTFIGNRPPSTPLVNITWASGQASPTETDDLTCLASGSNDPDGETVTYTYSWTSDSGGSITGDTVLASETVGGETWTCNALVSDGILSTTSSSSEQISLASNWLNCATHTMSSVSYTFDGWGGLRLGTTLKAIRDIDGDGLHDIISGGDNVQNGNHDYVYVLVSDNTYLSDSYRYGTMSERLGWSIGGNGDINGDGLNDFAMGAPDGYGHNTKAGRVYVFLGDSAYSSTSLWYNYMINGYYPYDRFGSALSLEGDFDGDGLNDLLVGAPDFDYSNKTGSGATYIFLASSFGSNWSISSSSADYIYYGEQNSHFLGKYVGAGDFDGDGLDDLYSVSTGGGNGGGVYIILGNNLQGTTSSTSDYYFNINPVSAIDSGDIDGDGLEDLVIAQRTAANWQGEIYIFLGSNIANQSRTIQSSDADITLLGESSGLGAGYSISVSGDLDNDGLDDILIGVPFFDSSVGKAYLLLSQTLLNNVGSYDLSNSDVIFEGDATEYFGYSVSHVDDRDGDGFQEVAIGIPESSVGGSSSGQIAIFEPCE